MIPPVQLVPPDKFQTNTPASNQQRKPIHQKSPLDTDNWYCQRCDKYFSIPKHDSIKCEKVNCPYCGSDIIDNLETKSGGDKFWMNI